MGFGRFLQLVEVVVKEKPRAMTYIPWKFLKWILPSRLLNRSHPTKLARWHAVAQPRVALASKQLWYPLDPLEFDWLVHHDDFCEEYRNIIPKKDHQLSSVTNIGYHRIS